MEHNYWVVGAMWGGSEDVLDTFFLRGYWYCWGPDVRDVSGSNIGNSIKAQRERFRHIKRGDRIAVKKLLGRGSSDMEVRALGVVKDIDEKEWRIYVDWIPTGKMNRKVPLHGCTASIHGPFEQSDAWVQQVFCI